MRAFHLRLAGSALLLASACSIPLQHDLSEEDANEIYVLLQHHGIDATKVKEGEGKETHYVITVPKPDVVSAAKLLKDNSLPRPVAAGLAIFKQTKGMIPTQTEERAMFIEALGGEVANALNRIPGVLEARVIVMIPETAELTQPDQKPKPSASVLLKYTSADGKPPVQPEEVREFVSKAVPELNKDNVKVLLTEVKSIKEVEVDLDQRMVSHLGVRLERASVGTFRLWIAALTLALLGTGGALAFVMARKPTSSSPRRSTKSET